MNEMLKTARPHSVLIVSAGPNYGGEGSEAIVWGTAGATSSCARPASLPSSAR
jgi:hypothetical protein